jgi:excisionase family DNA binding protein
MNAVLIEKVTMEDVKRLVEVCISEGLERSINKATTEDDLLTEKQAAHLLQVSRQTLKNWRDAGLLPFVRIGKGIRYRKSQLNKSGQPFKAKAHV